VSTPSDEIRRALPHREPFLFVQRIVDRDADHVLAAARFPPDTPFFAGHFPGNPIVPGVILLEALAQTAGLLMGAAGDDRAPAGALAQVRAARFRHSAGPDEEITLEARRLRSLGPVHLFACTARVGDRRLVEAELALAIHGS
jgi:3-hydroxyacyl-[acyl-carrier-protein] dehydratase